MNDIARIAAPDYVPTDSKEPSSFIVASMRWLIPSKGDIIRARIRTIGVKEHQFIMERGHLNTVQGFFFIYIFLNLHFVY